MAQKDSRERGKGAKPDYPVVKLISCPIRLSYPAFFDPKKNDQDQDVWECEALVPPNKDGDAFLDKLDAALVEVMTEHFGPEDEWPRGRNDYQPSDKIKSVNPDKLPGPGITKDWSTFTARSYSQIGVVDADRNEVLNKREVYGGRWARLSLSITVYDNKSKGPTIYLNNVQLLSNDESFGGRPSAENEFDKWDGEDLAPGGSRERGRRDDRRDDRSEREDARGDRGRGGGRGSRDDGRGDDRAGARSDRDEGRSDQSNSRRGRDASRDDEGPSRGRGRDDDRGRDNRDQDRDRGRGGARSDRDTGRDGGRTRGGDDDRRGGDREDRSSGRGREDDRDRGGSRGAPRGGRDDRDDDRRPSRGRDDRDDRDQGSDDDWT